MSENDKPRLLAREEAEFPEGRVTLYYPHWMSRASVDELEKQLRLVLRKMKRRSVQAEGDPDDA